MCNHQTRAGDFANWHDLISPLKGPWFAIEALLFGIIVAISAWPAFAAAGALAEFLQKAPL